MTTTPYNFNGRTEYLATDVLTSAPRGHSGESLQFFKIDRHLSDKELKNEYFKRSLEPATLDHLLAFDKNHRNKMDSMKHVATHWQDSKGKWCYAALNQWHDGERSVNVGRNDVGWYGSWWFAGLASSTQRSEPQISSDTLSLKLAIKKVKEAGYQVSKIL